MSYSANDNQNFFVQSGRTTSRVLHTPGGECSISLGGYTPAELERMRQMREKSNNAAKSEEINSTVVAKENSSNTKVKESKEDAKRLESIAEQAHRSEGDDQPKEEDTKEEAVTSRSMTKSTTQSQPVASVKKGVSSNAFASASTTNSFNVLTDRPTSRITNPPGGKDNLWF
jgi:hypothetical protein